MHNAFPFQTKKRETKTMTANRQLISTGTPVTTTTENPEIRAEFTSEAIASRKWGVKGIVIGHSDSHGLCYQVQHEDDTVAWYDPSELTTPEISSNWNTALQEREHLIPGQLFLGFPFKEGFPKNTAGQFEIILQDGSLEKARVDLDTQYRSEGVRWRTSENATYDKHVVVAWREVME